MTTREIYENHCKDYLEYTGNDTKYEWAASAVFDLVTYDGELDKEVVGLILEVCKVILARSTYKYIDTDDVCYVTYILVCNILNQFNWINWGTSIRGAWFEEWPVTSNKPRAILRYNLKDYGVDEVPFTIENLKALIDFIEHDD